MAINTINSILLILQSHGEIIQYIIIYSLMFVEGPIVTYIVSFAAALGYFNIGIIFVLGILGYIIPEIILFRIGGLIRAKGLKRVVSYFGLHKKRIAWLEKNLKNHTIKTIMIIKTVPPLPIPGLVLCGFIRMPFAKFFWINLIFDILYTILFVSLGYYMGLAANTSLKYFKLTQYLLPLAVILAIVIYLLIRKISSIEIKKIKY